MSAVARKTDGDETPVLLDSGFRRNDEKNKLVNEQGGFWKLDSTIIYRQYITTT